MSTPNNHIPTILIIGAGLGGLLLYHGIQKHLNKNVEKFNVKIFERDIGPQGILLLFQL
jgi:cation diffusion facilitator CzcD-associated flavoprotein CzcO